MSVKVLRGSKFRISGAVGGGNTRVETMSKKKKFFLSWNDSNEHGGEERMIHGMVSGAQNEICKRHT